MSGVLTKSEFILAAQEILAASDVPLSAAEITEKAKENRQLQGSKGETPEKTMYEKLWRNSDGRGLNYFISINGKFALNPKYRASRREGDLLGLGGEHLVLSELFFHNFGAGDIPHDEGMDIWAKRQGETFYIQVKTKNRDNRGRFIIHIKVKNFEKFRKESNNIFFAFLLRESRSGPTNCLVMSQKSVEEAIKDGSIPLMGKEKNLYRLEFRLKEEGKVFLRQKDVSKFLNAWESIR